MATNIVVQPRRNLALPVALWALQLLVVFVILKAAAAKLTGNPYMVQIFDKIGAGQWFRYFIGTLEVLGSVGLLIPRVSGAAALLLSGVMAGAVLTHLTLIGGSPALPAFLLVSLLVIAWARLGRHI